MAWPKSHTSVETLRRRHVAGQHAEEFDAWVLGGEVRQHLIKLAARADVLKPRC